jgi:hypothetical protein
MKIFKKQQCEKLDEIICDICGESCKKNLGENESASLTSTWGYDSKKDLTRHNIDLCENCFDKTIDFLKSIRKTLPSNNDPLDGNFYEIY